MRKDLYAAREVAELLGLHVKTVRHYVRQGRLKSTRVGKQYRIARQDLEVFIGHAIGDRDAAPPPAIDVSGVVQLEGLGRTFADRVTNMLMAAVQGHGDDTLQLNTIYDEERARLKVMVFGSIESTITVLQMVQHLVEQ